MAGPNPSDPPPPPPHDGWSPYPLPQWGSVYPPPPPPPPPDPRSWRHVVLVALAVVTSVALVAVLMVGAVMVVRGRYEKATGVSNGAPVLSLPPIATPPPIATEPAIGSPPMAIPPLTTAVDPLPAALPTGSPVAGGSAQPIGWRPIDDGTVRVTPTATGADVELVRPGQHEWVTLPLSTNFQAVRIDANVTVTHDSAGNRVGLACRTAEQGYGATFSIDASGEWFMSLDWAEGPTLVGTAQLAQIPPDGAATTLSVVCAETNRSFEMMYAINGTVVADVVTPLVTWDAWHPAVYLCSCNGLESMSVDSVVVSTLPGPASGSG